MPKPHADNYRDYVRKRTTQLIHEGYDADQAYAIANSEARKMFPGHGTEGDSAMAWRTTYEEYRERVVKALVKYNELGLDGAKRWVSDHEERVRSFYDSGHMSPEDVPFNVRTKGYASESPTRDPWVVAVRTTEPEKIERLAGMKGIRTAKGVGFVFYDDELAKSLASRLTRAGHIVTWGPEASIAAEEGAPIVVGLEESTMPKAERAKLEREVWKKTPKDDRAIVRGERSILVDTDTKGGGRFTTTYPLSKISDEKLREFAHGQLQSQSHAAEAPFSAPERDPKDVDAGKKYGTAKDARAVYNMLHEQLNKESQEVFLVLPLDLHGDLLAPPCEIARGQRDRVNVDPADVLRPVIQHNASGFIVIHNHPSGHSKPSDADRSLTKRIKQSAKPFEPVVLVDHVIVGRREYYSIMEDKHYKVK